MQSHWRFLLADTPTLNIIGEIPATGKQLNLVLNRPGNANFSLPLDSEMAYQIRTLSTSLLAVRDTTVHWSGPIWTLNAAAEQNKLSVTAMGWLEELNKRIIRGAYTDLRPVNVPTEEQQMTNVDSAEIARLLVVKANAQRDMDGTIRPTHISTAASYPTTVNRTRNYEKNQNIGQAIQELSDIEAGFDYGVDPVSRQLMIYYNTVAGTIKGFGTDRPDVVLAYRWGPSNLMQAGYQEDANTMCNRHLAQARYGQAIAEDRLSMADTGFMFEEFTSLSDVTDTNIALAYAGAEVATRAYPQRVYSLTPFPYADGNGVPRPLDDYNVGDIVRLTARQGAFEVDKQAQRVYGMTIDIDDNGNERLSSLQVTPS